MGFEVNEDEVTTGVNTIRGLLAATLVPNPTTKNSRLVMRVAQNTSLDIQVRNLLGQIVYTTQADLLKGKQELNLPTTN